MEEGRSDLKQEPNKVELALSLEKVRQIEGGGDGNVDERKKVCGLLRLFLACMVSGGIQYGWALQLSLLSPYSQVQRRRCCISCLFPA